jgi:PAS domain S-box-containing protein
MAETKSHRVLIVEDEGLIAHDISKRLEALGHVVVDTVSTADAAIELAAQSDVILMDIRIDGPRDGIDAAREIRQKYRLPVIFLTAHADRSTLERAKLTGPFAYLVKPLASASLQSAIEIAVYRHRMERTLEEQEAWLRTTLASVADAAVVTGPDACIRSLNRAAERITGWTSQEAKGLPYSKVLRMVEIVTTAGEQTLEPAEPVELALLRDGPVEFDPRWRLLDRAGRELVVEGSAAPVRDASAVFGTVLTFRDVTARRWQEQQARQAQRMDTAARLAASVSQEYSNLVAIIRTHAEHLLDHFGEYSPVRRSIEEIRQAASAASLITRRMASFGSRPSAQLDTFTLNSLLRRMTKLIQSAAGDQIEVSLQIDPGSGKVQAKRDQMEQAVMNLVLQACRSMPNGGAMTLKTGQVDLPLNSSEACSYSMLAVVYSGDEPDLDHLFEPVAAQEHSLALPVAHAIVRDHGGYLTAQAVPGGGTRLELMLPRLAEQPALEAPVKTPAACILLVESRDGIRAQLHNFFESSGYNLLEAGGISEAVMLGQMYAGRLDLLISEESGAGEIAAALKPCHPGMGVLQIVDRAERGPGEIQRPFSQRMLMEKARALLTAQTDPDAVSEEFIPAEEPRQTQIVAKP